MRTKIAVFSLFMEAWQYSALKAKFAALQNQLLGTKESTSPNSNSASLEAVDVEMSADQSCDTNKGAVKRKAEDYSTNNDTATKARYIMMLDAYTQTEASFVADSRKDTAQVVNAVMENQRRLDHIESILENLEEKLDLLLGDHSEHSKERISLCGAVSGADIKSSAILRSDSQEPLHTPPLENPGISEATVHNQSANTTMRSQVMCYSPIVKYITARAPSTQPPVCGDLAQSSNHDDGLVTKSETPNEKSEAPARGMDLSVLEANLHELVPVIIACNSKTERNLTAEVSLQDLINGNQLSLEGVENINLSRGCWLGNKTDEDNRVWYCGDSRIIHRAEASGSNPAKLSLNLLEALCTREEMAASNVNGARGRELLDPIKIKAIQVHVNFKFPIEAEKQELRWMVLKPRIDSKCRAQRRLRRDQQARLNRSHVPIRQSRNSRTPVIDQKVREELLYGYVKPETNDNDHLVEGLQSTEEDNNKMSHVTSFDESQPTMVALPD